MYGEDYHAIVDGDSRSGLAPAVQEEGFIARSWNCIKTGFTIGFELAGGKQELRNELAKNLLSHCSVLSQERLIQEEVARAHCAMDSDNIETLVNLEDLWYLRDEAKAQEAGSDLEAWKASIVGGGDALSDAGEERRLDMDAPSSAMMRLVVRRHQRRVEAGVVPADPEEDVEMLDAWDSMWHRFDLLAPILFDKHRLSQQRLEKMIPEEHQKEEHAAEARLGQLVRYSDALERVYRKMHSQAFAIQRAILKRLGRAWPCCMEICRHEGPCEAVIATNLQSDTADEDFEPSVHQVEEALSINMKGHLDTLRRLNAHIQQSMATLSQEGIPETERERLTADLKRDMDIRQSHMPWETQWYCGVGRDFDTCPDTSVPRFEMDDDARSRVVARMFGSLREHLELEEEEGRMSELLSLDEHLKLFQITFSNQVHVPGIPAAEAIPYQLSNETLELALQFRRESMESMEDGEAKLREEAAIVEEEEAIQVVNHADIPMAVTMLAALQGPLELQVSRISLIGRDMYMAMFCWDILAFLLFIGVLYGSGARDNPGNTPVISEDVNSFSLQFLSDAFIYFCFICADRAVYVCMSCQKKVLLQIANVFWIHIVLCWNPPMQLQVSSLVSAFYVIKCIYFAISAQQIMSGYPEHCQDDYWRKIPDQEFLDPKQFEPSMFRYYGLIVYRIIPFWFEMRTILDWAFTPTTLRMDQWFRVEDIATQLFKNKCDRAWERMDLGPNGNRTRGSTQVWWMKVLQGYLMFIILALLLWAPLFVFSNGNPAVSPNTATSSALTISLDVVEQDTNIHTSYPLYKTGDGYLNAITPEDLQAASPTRDVVTLSTVSNKALNNMMRIGQSYSTEIIQFPSSSPSLFEFSTPLQRQLADTFLDANVTRVQAQLTVSYAFTRQGPANNKDLSFPTIGVDQPVTRDLNLTGVAGFQDAISAVMRRPCNRSLTRDTSTRLAKEYRIVTTESDAVFAIQFPMSLEATASTKIEGFAPDSDNPLLLSMELQRQWNERTLSCDAWWDAGICNPTPVGDAGNFTCDSPFVGLASEKQLAAIFAFFQGLGVIGVYTTVVLVIGRALRPTFSNLAGQVMFLEMQASHSFTPKIVLPFSLSLDIVLPSVSDPSLPL